MTVDLVWDLKKKKSQQVSLHLWPHEMIRKTSRHTNQKESKQRRCPLMSVVKSLSEWMNATLLPPQLICLAWVCGWLRVSSQGWTGCGCPRYKYSTVQYSTKLPAWDTYTNEHINTSANCCIKAATKHYAGLKLHSNSAWLAANGERLKAKAWQYSVLERGRQRE